MKRSGVLARIAGVSLLSLLAAACAADSQRFAGLGGSDKMSTGSLPPADVPGGNPGSSYAGGSYGGSSQVQTSMLPPPSGAPASGYQGGSGHQSGGQAGGFAGVRPDAMSGSATGWTAAGGASVAVGQGDTVQSVADRYGVPPAAIRAANNLGGNGLTPGSSIVIPVYNPGGSAVAAAPAATAGYAQPATRAVGHVAAAPARANHAVQAGGASVNAGAASVNERAAQAIAASRATAQQPVKPGQPPRSLQQQAQTVAGQPGQAAQKAQAQAQLTAAQAKAQAAQAKTVAKPVQVVEPAKVAAQPQPKPVEQKAPQQVAIAAPAAQPAKEEAAQASSASFRWPARGRIIQGFNGRNGNEGINIALPEGTPVKAAEGGVVAYAGSELKGYGNLVLIRHENGWVSAYANNGELTVKRGEKVSRGQTVAKSGQSGNVSTPQLHFELRKGSTPVDPMPHLAGG